MSGTIPVSVIGGYLGAGKTTLVNHLLRHAHGLRLAVLVNDFGALPVDADLIEAADEGVLSIAGGCVCCSYGSDLMAALQTLARRDPAPEQVIIETSGVALPGAVARSIGLIRGFAAEAVVVLADAETVRARADDRYMGDTVRRQLAQADLVLLNKVDLIDPAAFAALRAWLRTAAPQATTFDCTRARVPIERVLGRPSRPRSASPTDSPEAARFLRIEAAATRYESLEFQSPPPLDVQTLAAALAEPGLGLLRAKGVLCGRDALLVSLQVVGGRWEIAPYAGAGRPTPGLVCIGPAGSIDRAGIERALARAALCDAPERR